MARSTRTIFLDANVLAAPVTRTLLLVGIEAIDVVATWSQHAEQSRQAAVRAKVEHPFLILKRDFGFTKTRYRGIGKNLNHLHVLLASAN